MGGIVGRQPTSLQWALGLLVARLLPVCVMLLAPGGIPLIGLPDVSASDERPILLLGDKDYPPITYVENGAAKGVDVDLAKALAKPMGREIRVELMDWGLAQEKVLRGDADGLLSMSMSDERREQYDFTEQTFTNQFGLFVRSANMTIRGASDLSGKRVGVTAGGFPRRFLETHPGVTLVLIENYEDGFDRLAAGAIDAVAADLWVAAYTIQARRVRGVTIAGDPFATRQAGIAVKKGNLALVNEFNRAIRTLASDGTIAQIQERWRPQQVVFLSRERLQAMIALAVGAFLVILLGAMALWVITLKRSIRVRRRVEADLRGSEERFRVLVEQAPEAILVFDVDQGHFVETNKKAERLFGCDREELLTSGPERFLASRQPDGRPINESMEEYTERALAGEVLVLERAVRHAGGEDRVCEVRLVRLPSAGRKLIRASYIDITERKRVEAERQALQSQLIRRTQQLEAVRSVTAEVTRELDLDKVLWLIATRVGELLGNCHGGVALWDHAEGILLVHTESGQPDRLQPRVKLGEGLVGKVAERREGLIVNDYRHWPGALAWVLERTQIAAGMAEPLLYRDRLVGVIRVDTEDRGVAFTPEDQAILRLFADQAAIAIENARLYDELKQAYGRLQSLAARAAEGGEAERRRLARELHDQVGQNLSALGLNLTMLRGQPDEMTDVASRSRVADSLSLVERTAAAIRSVMADLRPGVLDDYGLVAALRWLGDEVAARTGIVVDVQGEEGAPRLAAPVENSLFRIAQEALTNVTKHAQASEVTVSVDVEDRIVRLLIADNGVGFDPRLTGTPQGGYHWGLGAMAERALGVGGRCRIESRPGKGTHVIVEVPL